MLPDTFVMAADDMDVLSVAYSLLNMTATGGSTARFKGKTYNFAIEAAEFENMVMTLCATEEASRLVDDEMIAPETSVTWNGHSGDENLENATKTYRSIAKQKEQTQW